MLIIHLINLSTATCNKITRQKIINILSELSKVTLWHHAHNRSLQKDKTVKQQYLMLYKEKTLIKYILYKSKCKYSLSVKFLCFLTLIITHQHFYTFQIFTINNDIWLLSKNWLQDFYKHYFKLKTRRVKTLNLAQHNYNIYDKMMQWFTMINIELNDSAILLKNVYNKNKINILLSILSSLKILINTENLRNYKSTEVK